MLNGNHYDGTDVNFISCKVGRDSNESLNANWLENPPFFVVTLLFPFATYIFSLSFFIYSPFFHEYKSSPISERNLLIFNQIIIMYICLIRGKKYKVKPKNIMFCNIRYLGQHLLLPWGKSNFFFNQNLLQLPMYVPYFILLKFNKQKYIRKAVIYFVLLQISKCFFHTLLYTSCQ